MAASLANVVHRSIEIIVGMILNPGKCDALRSIHRSISIKTSIELSIDYTIHFKVLLFSLLPTFTL